MQRVFRLFSYVRDFPLEVVECYQPFCDGLELLEMGKLFEAIKKLNECVGILEKNNLLGNTGHNYVLSRLALAQRAQKLNRECELSLETIVENCKKISPIFVIEIQLFGVFSLCLSIS